MGGPDSQKRWPRKRPRLLMFWKCWDFLDTLIYPLSRKSQDWDSQCFENAEIFLTCLQSHTFCREFLLRLFAKSRSGTPMPIGFPFSRILLSCSFSICACNINLWMFLWAYIKCSFLFLSSALWCDLSLELSFFLKDDFLRCEIQRGNEKKNRSQTDNEKQSMKDRKKEWETNK